MAIKIRMTNRWQDLIGTGCKGYCDAGTTFARLVEVFGQPAPFDPDDGDGKTRVKWIGVINNHAFTIYDYKNDRPVEEMTGDDFHIGGKSKEVVALVNAAL